MIRVKCPGCGREREYGDYLAGLTAVCKGCGGRVPVPSAALPSPAGADAITAAPGVTPPQAPAEPAVEAIKPLPGITPSPLPTTSTLAATEVRSVSFDAPAPPSPPDWAIEHAAVSLRVGHGAPEIEQRLVGRGLTPADAAAAVTKALEGGVRGEFTPLQAAEQGQLIHRILAAVVGCACLGLGYWFNGGISAGRTLLWLLLPLACVWFPGPMAGPTHPARVILLRWAGWLAILAILGYRVLLLWITS